MAFAKRIGNLLKQATSSNPSIYQAIRCMSSSKLFIGGLSYNTDDQSLKEAFTSYGQVIEARVIVDRETGRSRGFGFVTFTSSDEASGAINGMNGKDLHGRMIRVDFATDRARGGGGYVGGGGYGSSGGGWSSGYGGGGGFGGASGDYGGSGATGGYSGSRANGDGYSTGGGGSFGGGSDSYGSGGGGANHGVAGGSYGSDSFAGDAAGSYGGSGAMGYDGDQADQFGNRGGTGARYEDGDFNSQQDDSFEPGDFADKRS